ncbi:MAG: hypothetical protein KDA80_20595 [Planctomycetaceae bacterium]|nr:hypothetical protein [Planctomycetaceae bacterium]
MSSDDQGERMEAEQKRRRKRKKRRREEERPPMPSEPFCNWLVVIVGAVILGIGWYFATQGYFSSLILGVGFAFVLCGLMMSGGD